MTSKLLRIPCLCRLQWRHNQDVTGQVLTGLLWEKQYLVRSTSTSRWHFLATDISPSSVIRLHPLRLRCVSCVQREATLYRGVSVMCTFQYSDSCCKFGLWATSIMTPASVILHMNSVSNAAGSDLHVSSFWPFAVKTLALVLCHRQQSWVHGCLQLQQRWPCVPLAGIEIEDLKVVAVKFSQILVRDICCKL